MSNMQTFKCKACGHELQAGMPPFTCPKCNAKGKGFAKLADAPGAAAPAPPAPKPVPPVAALKPAAPVPPPRPVNTAPPVPVPPPRPVAPPPPPPKPVVAAPPPPAPKPAPPTPAPPPAPSLTTRASTPTAPSPSPSLTLPAQTAPKPAAPTAPATRVVWKYAAQAAPGASVRPLRNCPAMDSKDRIFVAAQHKLAAFIEDGPGYKLLWEYATGGFIPASPSVGPDGHARVHSSDGKLHAVNMLGVAAFSPVSVGEPLGSAGPLVDAAGNTWICAYHGGLLKIDPQGRTEEKAYYRTRQRFDCPGLIRGGVLHVGAEDGCIYAIDLSGSRGKNLWDHAADQGRTGWYVNAAPALVPGLGPGGEPALVVAGRDDALHAFTRSGQKLWSEPLGGQLLGSPVADEDGAIYLGVSHSKRGESGRGELVKVEGSSLKPRTIFECPAAIESTPVLADDGLLYFGDNGGTVYAIDRAGSLKWSEPVGSPVRSCGAILGKGRLAFGLDDGSLVVLRCNSERAARKGWPKFLGTPEQSGVASL